MECRKTNRASEKLGTPLNTATHVGQKCQKRGEAKEQKNYSKKLMAEIVPDLLKSINLHMQDDQNPNRINHSKNVESQTQKENLEKQQDKDTIGYTLNGVFCNGKGDGCHFDYFLWFPLFSTF